MEQAKFNKKLCSTCIYRGYLHTTVNHVNDIYCAYHKTTETATCLKRGPKGTVRDIRGTGGRKKCKLYENGKSVVHGLKSKTDYLFIKDKEVADDKS